MRKVALAELGGRGSFTANPRFSVQAVGVAANSDPLADAFQAGFAEGQRAARDAATARDEEAASTQAAIELAFARFDADSAALLEDRMRDAVGVICHAMAGEIALDPVRLARRVEVAAGMLRRAHDARIVCLHPSDLALVEGRVPAALKLTSDPSLARGQLRVESEDGGIEDGADQWRAALHEALGTCLP